MGYSARYHAASLAAVFLALAVGILVGVGFASDVVTGTAESLEESLKSDLEQARGANSDLQAQIEAEQSFNDAILPSVLTERLRNRAVALIALGGLSEKTAASVEDAVEPAGGSLAEVAVVAEPPDLEALASTLKGKRARAVARGDSEALAALGREAARSLVRGGRRFDDIRSTLLSRYSGSPDGIDAVVVVSERPDGLDPEETASSSAIESGLVTGLRSAQLPVVGAELSDADPSTIEFFDSRGLSSVDSIDLRSGKVALVYALRGGVEGSFGIKESADGLLPDLLGRDRAGGG